MQYQVFIQNPADRLFTASVVGLPNVKSNRTTEEEAIAPKGHKIYSAVDFRCRFPDGRMGSNPALATPEHGQQFYTLLVEETAQSYSEFIQAN